MIEDFDCKEISKELYDDIQKVRLKNAANLRKVRQKYSKKLAEATAEQILDFVRYFIGNYNYSWIAYEIIYCHETALKIISEKELKEFGKQIDSWGASDIFAIFLAGPAWRSSQVSDDLILSWAHSNDYWWRRTALVCTVSLNKRTKGGQGDIPRTLKICRVLLEDKNDKVIKALSWALRELIPHDSESVQKFISENENKLAAQVKREVKNKLATGVKNPKGKQREKTA